MTDIRAAVADSARALARSLESGEGPFLLRHSGLAIPDAVVAALADDPGARTTLLVARFDPAGSQGAGSAPPVRVLHHRVHSAGSAHHDVAGATHASVGALVVAADDRAAAAVAIDGLAATAATAGWDADDIFDLAVVALVRGGVGVGSVEVPDVPWRRAVGGPDGAGRRDDMEAVDPQRLARAMANRPDDGFYSTFVLRRASKPITAWAIRAGVSPNALTLASLAIGLAAACCFALGVRPALVAGAVLLQASIIIDCCDGEVARATRRYSALGAWLDASTDRVKEFLAYAGLATGAAVAWGQDAWPLALVLVLVVTVRHTSDYDFSRIQRLREGVVPRRPLDERSDGAPEAVGGVAGISARMNRRRPVMWAKRVAHMPIGERWLVLSVLAAVAGPVWALVGLLVLVLLALAYVTAGRVLRTLAWRGPTPPSGAVMLVRQLGMILLGRPLARAASGPAGWTVPPALRLVELAVAVIAGLLLPGGAAVAAFWWCVVVAYHHYDALYRSLQDRGMPRWLVAMSLGVEGRTLVVVAAAAGGMMAPMLGVGSAVLAVVVVAVAAVQWLSAQRPRAQSRSGQSG